MKDIDVLSSQILLSNHVQEGAVSIYAGLVARNILGIHRVLVADVTMLESTKELFESREIRGNWYLVLDGNNRTVSYSLVRDKVPCTLLESDDDIALSKRLGDEGRMSRIVHDHVNLEALIQDGLDASKRIFSKPRIAIEYARASIQSRMIDIAKFPQFLHDQIILK